MYHVLKEDKFLGVYGFTTGGLYHAHRGHPRRGGDNDFGMAFGGGIRFKALRFELQGHHVFGDDAFTYVTPTVKLYLGF